MKVALEPPTRTKLLKQLSVRLGNTEGFIMYNSILQNNGGTTNNNEQCASFHLLSRKKRKSDGQSITLL